ncbi:MAG: 2-oxoacid:acceptor oxidoreductase subunit alpha [archaeon]|nr:2-oxoacid:acceptor oxidoreductase subunit alpha [archaeon]
MIKNDLAVMIAGRAGDGSLITGEILAKVFKRMGLEVFTYRDFPSNIRGLPTNYTIRVKERVIMARKDYIDILLALDDEAVKLHFNELAKGGVIIYDNSLGELPKDLALNDVHVYKAPMKRMAIENLGGSSGEIMKNTISIGIMAKLFSIDEDIAKEVIKDTFLRKGDKMVKMNLQAYELGKSYVIDRLEKRDEYILERKEDKGKILITGDEAIAYGAIVAGCRFYSGYPITPVTEIMEWLAHRLPNHNGVVVQAEDEIAAINMAIGASYAGARAMVGTSGPGQSLMTEAVGLAGITETPIVIVHGQRGGPGTGLPTKTEQSDIKHIVYATHGEFPRIVISPGSIKEAFYMTVKAFNLAERYQCPVFILIEQALCQNKQTIDKFDLSKVEIDRGKLLREDDLKRIKEFKRYELTEDGISPRTIPSMEGGIFEANSNEHDESGYSTENPEIRTAMMNKRLRKIDSMKKDLIPSRVFGDERAKIAIIGIGSTLGPLLEVMDQLKLKGIEAKFLQIRTLFPFPEDEVLEYVKNVEKIFVVENNATGQLASLIKANLGSYKILSILKYDGRAFRPIEISSKIKEAL